VAASELFKAAKYKIDGKTLKAEELVTFYQSLIKNYPIISIEDGLAEGDWEGWQLITRKCSSKIQL